MSRHQPNHQLNHYNDRMPSLYIKSRLVPMLLILILLSRSIPTTSGSSDKKSAVSLYQYGETTKQVVTLNKDNIQSALKDPANPFWFLKFYAPWCGHCKKLAPVLDKVAIQTTGRMSIGTIDCTVEKKLCDKYKVRGYPTLKFSIDHDVYEYDGGRTEHALVEFSKKMVRPIIQSIPSLDDMIQQLVDGFDTTGSGSGVGFLFYDPNILYNHQPGFSLEQILNTTPLGQHYNQLCRKLRNLSTSFYVLNVSAESDTESGSTTMVDIYKSLQLNTDGVARPFLCRMEVNVPPRCYDAITNIGTTSSTDGTIVIPSSLLQQSMKWVETECIPTVSQLGPHNFYKLGQSGKPLVIGIIDEGNQDQVEFTKTEFSKYATMTGPEHIRNKYYYAYFDGNMWKNFLSQFNVFPVDIPQILVLDVPIQQYYQNATYKLNIEDFLQDIEKGIIPSALSNDAGIKGQLIMLYRLILLYRPWSVLAIVIFLVTIVVAIVLCLQPSEELSAKRRQIKTKSQVELTAKRPTTTILEDTGDDNKNDNDDNNDTQTTTTPNDSDTKKEK